MSDRLGSTCVRRAAKEPSVASAGCPPGESYPAAMRCLVSRADVRQTHTCRVLRDENLAGSQFAWIVAKSAQNSRHSSRKTSEASDGTQPAHAPSAGSPTVIAAKVSVSCSPRRQGLATVTSRRPEDSFIAAEVSAVGGKRRTQDRVVVSRDQRQVGVIDWRGSRASGQHAISCTIQTAQQRQTRACRERAAEVAPNRLGSELGAAR